MEYRGLILFTGTKKVESLIEFIRINNRIKLNNFNFDFKDDWHPGLLMKLKNKKKIPDLLIILDSNISKYNMMYKEAVFNKIPVVSIIDSNQEIDNVSYGIPGMLNNTSLFFYENLFCNSILSGFSKEKFKII